MSSRPRNYRGSPPFGAMSCATSLTLQGKCATTLVHLSYRIGICFNLWYPQLQCLAAGLVVIYSVWLWSHASRDFKRVSPFCTKSVMLGKKTTKWPDTPLIPVTSEADVTVSFSSVLFIQFQPSQCYIMRLSKATCTSVSSVQNGDSNGTCFLQRMIRTRQKRLQRFTD